jgi:tRNA dimethylallyltransferase
MVGPSLESLEGCWYLTGATASGKTSVGIPLAQSLDAEIISMDSMAIYRGMDIGTAKPTPDQRQMVKHHVLDIVGPDEEFSIALYLRHVQSALMEIRGRGKSVLFVGGTPLYLKALVQGINEGPAADWAFRNEVMEEARRVGTESLHMRLQQVDPLSAAKLPPEDIRRIVRALEYHHLTGRPISHAQLHFDEAPAHAGKVFALQWARPSLHQRIHHRVDSMFAAGWVDEVRSLLAKYGNLGRTAGQAVGYREIIEHLRGSGNLQATIEQVKTRTRQFAKRQETWFRSIPSCNFIACHDALEPRVIADQIVRIGMAESSQNL